MKLHRLLLCLMANFPPIVLTQHDVPGCEAGMDDSECEDEQGLDTVTNTTTPQYKGGSLGINCRGDWIHCWGTSGIVDGILDTVPSIDDRDIFESGSHIICFKATGLGIPSNAGFCLFMQGHKFSQNQILRPNGQSVAGVNGATIKSLIPKLREHGCNSCSSIPLDPTNNPNTLGILTVNYVHDKHGCNKIHCPPAYPCSDPRNPYNQWALQSALNNPPATLTIVTTAEAAAFYIGSSTQATKKGYDDKGFLARLPNGTLAYMKNVCNTPAVVPQSIEAQKPGQVEGDGDKPVGGVGGTGSGGSGGGATGAGKGGSSGNGNGGNSGNGTLTGEKSNSTNYGNSSQDQLYGEEPPSTKEFEVPASPTAEPSPSPSSSSEPNQQLPAGWRGSGTGTNSGGGRRRR